LLALTAFDQFSCKTTSAPKRKFDSLSQSSVPSTVVETPYAQYGVTSGKLPVRKRGEFSCIVICSGWPSWVWTAMARKMDVMLVIVQDVLWISLIKAMTPSSEVVLWTEWDDCIWPNVDFVFSDYDCFQGKLKTLWPYISKLGILSKASRRFPKEWHHTAVNLIHSHAGGVTNGQWIVNIYSRGTAQNFTPQLHAQRDMSSVIDTMVSTGHPCPIPQCMKPSETPKVLEVRPGTYHFQGLLPWDGRQSTIIAPNIFSTTKWCKRRLTGSELLKILDVPDDIANKLKGASIKDLIGDLSFIPMKSLLSLVDAVLVNYSNAQSLIRQISLSSTLKSDANGIEQSPQSDSAAKLGILASLEELESSRIKVATKADDAEVPVHLWNNRIRFASTIQETPEEKLNKLNSLRNMALRWWKRKVQRDFIKWFKTKYLHLLHEAQQCTVTILSNTFDPLLTRTVPYYINVSRILNNKKAKVEWMAGRDCVERCAEASWWEWDSGSRPLFWRWPEEYQTIIRDGLPLWHSSSPPEYKVPQQMERDPVLREAVKGKLSTVRKKRYIQPGTVKALTSFFSVPKGDDDIRIVYNGTKSGLNDCLWAPWFPLPTIEQHLRAVEPGTFMADVDISEQFLNFILHEHTQPYAGVDLTMYFLDEVWDMKLTSRRSTLWERWTRCTMGFRPSPYQACQGMLHAEEVVRGDPLDASNPFHFDMVILNLPGDPIYQPNKPWVYKLRSSDNRIANDYFTYVDDVRSTGATSEETWQCSRRVASILTYLGVQDASRKRRGPSLEPGAWAGSIVLSSEGVVRVTISLERWQKAQSIIRWIGDCLESRSPLEHKTLERHRGFLVYVSRTYPFIVPYLKGIHLTLDSWRPWRKPDGWKMNAQEIQEALNDDGFPVDESFPTAAPSYVTPVPELHRDIMALQTLFQQDLPPKRLIRPSHTAIAVYGFGDASGTGFGSTLMIGNIVHYRHGQWNISIQEESSNYRELTNLVLSIEEVTHQGLLSNCELFFFTDNSTAEMAFHKGTSSSPKLFELVLRLRTLQMHHGLFLQVIHVAGTRMKAQGTDGLSRGSLADGVMMSQDMLTYVPLHESACSRQPSLRHWIQTWILAEPLNWLSPFDWFTTRHKTGCLAWCSPPAAAGAALEQLGSAIHKRPSTQHVILIPRLMTAAWRRLLGKICDLIFTVPVGSDVWPLFHHEPLIVGLYLPLSRHRPWRLQGTPFVDLVARELSDLPATDNNWGGNILCKFLQQARKLESMPQCMVRPLLLRE
jgi:hypothetical protein